MILVFAWIPDTDLQNPLEFLRWYEMFYSSKATLNRCLNIFRRVSGPQEDQVMIRGLELLTPTLISSRGQWINKLVPGNEISMKIQRYLNASWLVNVWSYWEGETTLMPCMSFCSVWLFLNCILYIKPIIISKRFPDICEPFNKSSSLDNSKL